MKEQKIIMQKIEFMARWTDTSYLNSPEYKERRRQNEILGIEDEDDIGEEEKFVYKPITMDMEDIKAFNKLDDVHTTIRAYEDDAYIANIPYAQFQEAYMKVMGCSIMSLKSPVPAKRNENEELDF